MTRRLAWIAGLTILLAGCADLAPANRHAQHPAGTYSEAINIEGRLSMKYQANGIEESLHGNFNWSQTDKQTVITLLSPLGQTLALITVTPGMSTLAQSGKPTRTASDPDSLTEMALGWPLPVAGMRNWLQGIALDQRGMRFVASAQSEPAASIITQDGWHIRYVAWQNAEGTPAAARPKRIDLSRNTAQAGDVSIRLVIDSWQPH